MYNVTLIFFLVNYYKAMVSIKRVDLEDDLLEMVVLEIKKPTAKPFLVFCWYRPPNLPVEHFDIFESYLKPAEMVFSGIYITGVITYCNLFNPGDSHTKCLVNILDLYQLTQVITEPIRITSSTFTLIKLFIDNNKESIMHCGV